MQRTICELYSYTKNYTSWYIALAEQLGGVSPSLAESPGTEPELARLKDAAAIIIDLVGLFEGVGRSEFDSVSLKNTIQGTPVAKGAQGFAKSPVRKFGEVNQQLKRKRSVYR